LYLLRIGSYFAYWLELRNATSATGGPGLSACSYLLGEIFTNYNKGWTTSSNILYLKLAHHATRDSEFTMTENGEAATSFRCESGQHLFAKKTHAHEGDAGR